MRRSTVLGVVAVLVAVSLGAAVERPPGAAPPIAATGIATAAAMQDEQCNTGPGFNVYGNWNTTTVGGTGQGPICVKAWPDGANNGGSTSPGVTRERIVVAAIIPSVDQTQALLKDATQAPGVPRDRATGSTGSWEDAVHDHLLPLLEFYETWGRDIEVRFVRSTGTDETAQRADAVTVKALKPFAAVDLLSQGLLTLDSELAKAKIVTFGTVTTAEQALAQQPYRWGATDGQATAVNAAAVAGRQLNGKKAEFAGDALRAQQRVFGAVAADTVDLARFTRDLKSHGATLKVSQAYDNPGGIVGDPVKSQEAAPTIVAKMKEAGVTTILLFADSSMVRSMMDAATKLDYFPEWFNSGVLYSELTLWARTYPVEQSEHMFGMSWLTPWLTPDNELTQLTDPENWYWGANQGTAAAVSVAPLLNWLVAGIHLAGPNLTPKTFQRGYFSAPAAGGAASGNPLSALIAYGRQTGLPYPSYMYGGTDFVPFWYDPDTTGIASVTGISAKGVAWYPKQGTRYKADTVTKKPLGYFQTDDAIISFETRPAAAPTPEYAGDCPTCPGATGSTKPGSPSDEGFVAKADGAGSTGV